MITHPEIARLHKTREIRAVRCCPRTPRIPEHSVKARENPAQLGEYYSPHVIQHTLTLLFRKWFAHNSSNGQQTTTHIPNIVRTFFRTKFAHFPTLGTHIILHRARTYSYTGSQVFLHWVCTYSYTGSAHIPTLGPHVFIHKVRTYSHTSSAHIPTQGLHIFLHRVSTYSHTRSAYIPTQGPHIFAH